MGAPRYLSLAEKIYMNIDNDGMLNEIYDSLLYNYSVRLFGFGVPLKEIDTVAALQFADLLSKSTGFEKSATHKIWAQEIVILLNWLYPDDPLIKNYLGNVLSSVGNYRGLSSFDESFESSNPMDRLFFAFDKESLRIPGEADKYFFRDQKTVFDNLDSSCFSYSGPTSMGKSFVVQRYIKNCVANGQKKNFAILVPTKALINEVRSNLINDLKQDLKEKNYRIVTASGDLVLAQEHNFIFVMTPERMLHLLIGIEDLHIDFLFVDEAHRIGIKGPRSTYYYKVISKVSQQSQKPIIVFASPNIPNPEIYLNTIPGVRKLQVQKLASKYTPVCQFKFMVDLLDNKVFSHNEHLKALPEVCDLPDGTRLCDVVARVGMEKQNVIYCSSRNKVISLAMDYSTQVNTSNITAERQQKLNQLANDIKNEVHDSCFLADLITKGIAYHVGYLPASIRLRIEKAFEDGDIRTIFCTSTLVEGVNLPADNLFITSYKNGPSNMDEVEFRNLVGRVGRIKYNLYGNVFLIRQEEATKAEKYKDLLNKDVPEQTLALDGCLTNRQRENIINALAAGDIEMAESLKSETGNDYAAMRNFALILSNDLSTGNITPVTEAFAKHMTDETAAAIIQNFPAEKTSDDITVSYDQIENLHDYIAAGGKYPDLDESGRIDHTKLTKFLLDLKRIFKWDVYEKWTIGKPGNKVLSWYAVILSQWIRGFRLKSIIDSALDYKTAHPETGVWVGNVQEAEFYEGTPEHKNLIIAETLGVIENVLLFSISNYFRKFSLEYMKYHNVDSFDNDWYQFVEYGTTNTTTIFLQQNGFSRETATYIIERRNRFIIEEEGKPIRLKKSLFTCGNISVETESQDIQFNIPELFE